MNAEEKAEIVSNIQKGLPPGWIVQFSTKHEDRVFYFYKATGVSTWTYPEAEDGLVKFSMKKKRHVADEKTPSNYSVQKKSKKDFSETNTSSNTFDKTHQKDRSLKRALSDEEACTVFDSSNFALDDSYGCQPELKVKKKKKKKKKKKDDTPTAPDSDNLMASTISPLNRPTAKIKQLDKQKTQQSPSTCGIEQQFTSSKASTNPETKPENIVNANCSLSGKLSKDDCNITPEQSLRYHHSPNNSWINPLLQKPDLIPPNNNINGCPKSDVEMIDISIVQEDGEPVVASPVVPAMLFVIVDTNVFLGSKGLSDIDEIVNWYPLPKGCFRRAIIVIPWIVLQELDLLKTKKSTAGKARQAVAFLNKHFCSKKPGIRGQTIMEAASFVEGLNVEMNDDRILQCCFFFSHLPGNHRTILFSKDSNLCNKAMINHFKSFSTFEGLVEGITSFCQAQKPGFDVKQTAVIHCDRIENDLNESKEFSQNDDSRETTRSGNTVLIEHESREESDANRDPLVLAQELTRDALSEILAAEMEEAYGKNFWLDIIIRKPPWTLMDVLQCIKKHWIAVFNMAGMDRLLSVHVDNLIKNLSSFLSRSPSKKPLQDQVGKLRYDFVCSSLVLLSGMGKRHMGNVAVKESIEKLKKIVKIVNSWRPSAPPNNAPAKQAENNIKELDTSIASPDDAEDIADEEEDPSPEALKDVSDENCILFWQILDKIWGCIIEHCVAIFRSLNFLSSPAVSQAPAELQQQLSSQVTAEIPSPDLAIHVIPLLMELIEGFLKALERFLSACKEHSGSPTLPECLDLLQTLWTITRAFLMNTSLENIKPSTVHQSCRNVEDQTKLFIGHQKLLAVAGVLKECSSAVANNMT